MSKKKNSKVVEEEKRAERESEVLVVEQTEPSALEASNVDEEALEATEIEKGAQADAAVPSEVAAIREDNETAQEVNEKIFPPKAKKKRSAFYKQAKKQIGKGRAYNLEEAVQLVKKISKQKVDGAIEIHLRLIAKKGKSESTSPKGIVFLPHGSGKERKIVVLNEEIIEEIARTKKTDFDIAIATPSLMPKLAKVAKILGPKRLMPDPKTGTVTDNPDKAIEEIQKGKTEYRLDEHNNLHQIIGRVSWDNDKLIENAKAVLNLFPKTRLESCYICSSFSPSVAIDLKSLT